MVRALLTVETGSARPPVCELIPGQLTTLGRHGSNSIVLPSKLVSRWHAAIVHEKGKWLLRNIGRPRNGTHINGQRIVHQAELLANQEVTLGDVRFRFTHGIEPAIDVKESESIDPEYSSTPDELRKFCSFLAQAANHADERGLILQALEIVRNQTQATIAGFLSLDPAIALPKVVTSEQVLIDGTLSRKLTEQVKKTGKAVWLEQLSARDPLSPSLGSYSDALCIPLFMDDRPLGAMHVYLHAGIFTGREFYFCEKLAGYLAINLRAVRERRSLEAENSRHRQHTPNPEHLIGSSALIGELRQTIGKVAAHTAIVLIRGESGVGKEMVALDLHRLGPRRDGPLVVVNCAAIAATLPEAELFGHSKGAFTGADRDRPGYFQQADEGTLFLDEIGELPLDCQAKLLRAMEGHGFRPVGATKEMRADVRIIAATNRNLEKEVARKRFRRDLLYRLQVIQIPVPPLREHPGDIPDLAAFFLDKLGKECGRSISLTAAALAKLQAYSWPGNVRQLRAVLESAVVMSDTGVLDAADLAIPVDSPTPVAGTLKLDELEKWAIRQALRKTKGNVTQAAKMLGIVRDTMAAKMKRWGIKRQI